MVRLRARWLDHGNGERLELGTVAVEAVAQCRGDVLVRGAQPDGAYLVQVLVVLLAEFQLERPQVFLQVRAGAWADDRDQGRRGQRGPAAQPASET
jgi:hypothetical protein